MYWHLSTFSSVAMSCSVTAFYGLNKDKDPSSGSNGPNGSTRRADRLRRAAARADGGDMRPGQGLRARKGLRDEQGEGEEVRVFSGQDEALGWKAKQSGSNGSCRSGVFAKELDASGRRCFLCCQPMRMLRIIRVRKENKRRALIGILDHC